MLGLNPVLNKDYCFSIEGCVHDHDAEAGFFPFQKKKAPDIVLRVEHVLSGHIILIVRLIENIAN
jgi:hypothetical protein